MALLLASGSVLAVNGFPELNMFLKYGKTLTSQEQKDSKIPFYLKVYVPKSWFTHFYILHFGLSAINVLLLCRRSWSLGTDLPLIILFNMVQSSRRLYECIYISKFSVTAKIHIFHYLAGIFFYTSINLIPFLLMDMGDSRYVSLCSRFSAVTMFSLASSDQFRNHSVLAKQKKYTFPNSVGLFRYLVCPHYFDECCIYLSFLVLRPSVSYLLVSAWVAINLSIAANQSYLFYIANNHIEKQYRIWPYVY